MSFVFRKAAPSDLPQVLEIYAHARAFMRQSGNPNQWGSHHPAESVLQADISSGRLYLGEENGKIEAVFAYLQGVDPTYVRIYEGHWLNDEPYGVIHRIAVATPGKDSAARCFDWALRQCQNLRIDTHRDNKPMQQALKKQGFQYCGIIYLANGDERIAFQKSIAKTGA